MSVFATSGVNRRVSEFPPIWYGNHKHAGTVYYPLQMMANNQAASNGALGAGALYFNLFQTPPWASTIDSMAIKVTTAAAGSAVMGIYSLGFSESLESIPHGMRLLGQTLEVDTGTTGAKAAAISVGTLVANRWYAAALLVQATISVQTIIAASHPLVGVMGNNTFAQSQSWPGWGGFTYTYSATMPGGDIPFAYSPNTRTPFSLGVAGANPAAIYGRFA